MRKRAIIQGHSKPALPAHVRLRFDELRRRWVMLAPEKVMWPDEISLDILKRCDGTATTDDIVAMLSEEYAAPEDAIRRDVTAFLQEWADKRIIVCGE